MKAERTRQEREEERRLAVHRTDELQKQLSVRRPLAVPHWRIAPTTAERHEPHTCGGGGGGPVFPLCAGAAGCSQAQEHTSIVYT